MGENAFRRSCNFSEVGVVKNGTYYNFCVMCLMAAFVPHRSNKYFHVIASNGIVTIIGSGDMLLALHRQATRSHRPSMAMPLAAAPCRASGLVLWHL
jgi:hypothetical protein